MGTKLIMNDIEEYKKVLKEYEKNQRLVTGPMGDSLQFEREKRIAYMRAYYHKNKAKFAEINRQYNQRKKEAKK